MAIETSARLCQVAVHSNGKTVSQREDTASHSNLILTLVQRALNESAIALEQLDCIAVVRGPGSFTGLRVGIAVAQGVAFAHGIPLLPLSSLQLTAWEWCRKIGQTSGDVAVLATIDARMSQLYACWYLANFSSVNTSPTSLLRPLGAEQLVSPQSLLQTEWPVFVDDAVKLQEYSDTVGNVNDIRRVIVGSGLSYAAELGINALARCEQGADVAISAEGMIDWVRQQPPGALDAEFVEPADLAPVYIRDNVAG